MFNIIIFSKNRPNQLNLLLRSLEKFIKLEYNLFVLYTYSNDEYKMGYDIIFDMYCDEINFIKENNFKKNVLDLINNDSDFTLFLVDDIVFIRDLKYGIYLENFYVDDSIYAIKLMVGKNIKQRFEYGKEIIQPKYFIDQTTTPFDSYLNERYCVWNWKNAKGAHFSYPAGVSTQIYRTKDLKKLFKTLNFNSPNTLELAMVQHPFNKPYMMSFEKNKLIIIQANMVQQDCMANQHGDKYTCEFLNKKWLDNQRIQLEPLLNLQDDVNEFLEVDFNFE